LRILKRGKKPGFYQKQFMDIPDRVTLQKILIYGIKSGVL